MRAELRSLPKELAEIVGAHLVAAGELVDTDPELAYGHAEAARRRAARLPIVREATAETAYAAGHFDVALSEYRALRRMTGENGFLPVMADCERALGDPQAAIKISREADGLQLSPPDWIEMRIVEAGARADLDQRAEAVRVLREALSRVGGRPAQTRSGERLRLPVARLHYALADLLLTDEASAEARRHFVDAAELDIEGETDAAERVDLMDGLQIDFDETDDETPDDETPDDETPDDETPDDETPDDDTDDETPADRREPEQGEPAEESPS